MGCIQCGAPTSKRLCTDCERAKHAEEAAPDPTDAARDLVDDSACKALITDTGKQCENGLKSNAAENGLCGTHAGSDRVKRVDEIDGEPYADFRDALVDAGVSGVHAYKLACFTNDPLRLWDTITALEPVEIAGETYDPSTLAAIADDVADLDELDVADHPLATDDCIALTGSGSRCTSGTYATNVVCGMHADVDDLETVLDDRADLPVFKVDGDEHRLVETRGDAVIAVDMTAREIVRLDGLADVVETKLADQDSSDDDVETFDGPTYVFACPACDVRFEGTDPYADCPSCGDVVSPHDHRRVVDAAPDVLVGVGEGDVIRVALDDTDRELEGTVAEISNGGWDSPTRGATIRVYVKDVDEVSDRLILESEIEHAADDWSPVAAFDHVFGADDPDDARVDMGTVASVEIVELEENNQVTENEDGDMNDTEQVDDENDEPDVPERPELLDSIEQGDTVKVLLANADRRVGDVTGIERHDDELFVDVDGVDGVDYFLHAGVDGDHWSSVDLLRDEGDDDPDVIGMVDEIERVESTSSADQDEGVDPIRFSNRKEALDDAGLSGREAEVVSLKEQGLTHPEIAEYLELPKSTVDEYSRRARRKFKQARELVAEVGGTYE